MPALALPETLCPCFAAIMSTPRIRKTTVDDPVVISMVAHGLGVSIMTELIMSGPVGPHGKGAAHRTPDLPGIGYCGPQPPGAETGSAGIDSMRRRDHSGNAVVTTIPVNKERISVKNCGVC